MTRIVTVLMLISPLLVFSQNNNQNNSVINSKYAATRVADSGRRMALISTEPTYYREKESWEPIDLTLIEKGGKLVNYTNSISVELQVNPDAQSMHKVLIGEDEIYFFPRKELFLTMGDNRTPVAEFFPDKSSAGEHSVRYTKGDDLIVDEFQILPGTLKNNLILNQLPAVLCGIDEGFLAVREEIVLPDGWKLVGSADESQVYKELFIQDESRRDILRIPFPAIHDAVSAMDGQALESCGYHLENRGGKWYLTTLVPMTWLSNSERTFPVTIDPTITVAAVAGGWQANVSYSNSVGFVGYYPSGSPFIHRTWLKWDVSSIPDNACISKVELQIYVDATSSSASAETVVVTEMMPTNTAGDFGPYSGINLPVYDDIGSGSYTSFSVSTVGTYGWYDLGATAVADVSTMVNTLDFFQLGIIMNNEVSTRWKRMASAQCYLRITYEDPPCSILPVELVDFSVKCENNYAELNWSTATEINNDYFTVWRSEDGIEFSKEAQLDGQGSFNGPTFYTWRSEDPDRATAYYQLSQTDFNGAVKYYAPQAIEGCSGDEILISSDGNGTLIILGEDIREVYLYDRSGRMITRYFQESDSESIVLYPKISEGSYFVKVMRRNNEVETQRIYFR